MEAPPARWGKFKFACKLNPSLGFSCRRWDRCLRERVHNGCEAGEKSFTSWKVSWSLGAAGTQPQHWWESRFAELRRIWWTPPFGSWNLKENNLRRTSVVISLIHLFQQIQLPYMARSHERAYQFHFLLASICTGCLSYSPSIVK